MELGTPLEQIVTVDETDTGVPDAGTFSLRGAWRVLISSWSGRVGLLMFAIMIGISIYVLTTYPSDFGSQLWSSPKDWADNPKTAAPKWTALWDENAVETQTGTLHEPATTGERGPAAVYDYDWPIAQTSGAFPTFLSTTIEGVRFNGRAPVIVVTLLRPDGGEIRLANLAVPAARTGEDAPVERYFDTPERILLTQSDTAQQSIQAWFDQTYPGDRDTPVTIADLNKALFGIPTGTGFSALQGDYTLRVQMLAADPDDSLQAVSNVYGGNVYGWMGTDSLGRNLWQGLLYGFPIALLIATVTAILATVLGASLGILSGYTGGLTDSVIQRAADIVSNVPILPLLIFLVFIIGPNLSVILLVLVAFSWPGLTILVRSMVLSLRSGQLVEAAQAMGASRWRIMSRHVFPQVAPFIVAQMIFAAPAAILAEASLSFLGLGDPSIPTWGQMLESGFRTGALYVGYWWWVIPPGVLIIVTALAFTLLALAMEQVVDPRLRDQR
ncbi:MAG: ABC transporter permease [Thermomicrobiales bacterium]|nr:ABC transporter permease [Thermomicrobiales bacterium]